jgi:hypothetical protein
VILLVFFKNVESVVEVHCYKHYLNQLFMNNISFFYVLMLVMFFACNEKNDHRSEAERIVSEWLGKTIHFPDSIVFSVFGQDTLVNDYSQAPFKLFLYIDAKGCTSCNFKMYQWKDLLVESDSIAGDMLSFILCVQPGDRSELIHLLQRDKFNYPVIIDDHDQFNKLNHFPEMPAFQCFLLDKDNTVLLVGNPILNPAVWELYKQLINTELSPTEVFGASVELIDEVVRLENVEVGITNRVKFRIKNSGTTPLVIRNVKTSCGCTNAEWEKQPIAAGETTVVHADIVMDHPGHFAKTLQVYGNMSNSPLVLSIVGVVE